ncbi:MAG: signal peptidase I [Bacillota bacterium]|nr:signal peptidase I [Thermoanaerobacteraceae bacterium]
MPEERKKTVVRKILDWLMNVIVVIAVLLVACVFLAPRYGINMHPVLSGSMEPALKVGGVVITRLIKVGEVKKGDVISYKIDEQRITHRVIEVNKADGKINFQTKGDANEEPDPYAVIPKTEKVPKVVLYIPYFGFLAGFLKHKTNFFLLIGIPAACLVALYLWDIWREARKTRREPVNWKSRV